MAETPQSLTLKDNRDATEVYELASRRVFFVLLTIVLLFGLANAYGQSPTGSKVDSPAALLEVSAPVDVRGGLYYQGRFRITAHEEITKATLVLAPGWLESTHINTVEPSPVGEASRDGDLALDFGHVAAGDRSPSTCSSRSTPTTSVGAVRTCGCTTTPSCSRPRSAT